MADTFLRLVAKDLFEKKGDDLSRVAVVFPNKRAGLFFNEYLAGESDKPLWSPAYISISELLQSLSPLQLGDPVLLICELYAVFLEKTGRDEPLDEFYFWGELLLSDFDDADKNRVPTDKLFCNLKDLKQIMEGYDFLSKEQEEAIRQFFRNFSVDKQTELKERFASLWDKLGDIYNEYTARLRAQGVAYEGMLYRDAIDRLDASSLPYDTYAFVGFNVLNKVEATLFKTLRDAGKALFYWDYDVFYTKMPGVKHEAGAFINRNLSTFPSELPEACFDNLAHPKKVTFISAPTENAQARYLPQWIRDTLAGREKENAVVLCNESLLLPVIHSIPDEVKHVNITMGFPLSQTPAYTFTDALLELQTTGYNPQSGRYDYESVLAVLKHPYTRLLSTAAEQVEHTITRNNHFYPLPSELGRDEYLHRLFTPCTGLQEVCFYITEQLKQAAAIYRKEQEQEDVFNQLYRESLFKCYTISNRMLSLIESGALAVRADTFKRLMHRLMGATSIPFHGEPAIGMQVMGVLETRNLDFRNLIIMSLNEGLLPKAGGDSSFIPYSLRKAFGMTTIEHRDAIYAYYFYRLLQRAENITLLYNTSSDGLNKGEASRFLLQFMVEWPHPITREFLQAGQSPQQAAAITIEKQPGMIAFQRKFSPSALNVYLDCKLKFYYKYVAGIRIKDEINTEIDSSLFGSIFHHTVELLYKQLTQRSRLILKEDIERILKDSTHIDSLVGRAFKDLFFHIAPDEKAEYNGTQLINSKVIATYVRQLLRIDMQYAPFEMIASEEAVEEAITIHTPGGTAEVRIGGTIDRIDSKDGTLRIVDYKTGGAPKTPADMEQLFTPAEDRPGYVLQTFLYAAIMCRKQGLKVAPSLLYIHKAASEEYSPIIEMGVRNGKTPVTNFSLLEDEFRERLSKLLEEIYDTNVPFTQTEFEKHCGYCDFKTICNK